MSETIAKLRNIGLSVAARCAPLPPLLARFALGVTFAQSGWGKLHRLPQVVEYFESLGIPAANLQAPFVAGVELVGGILLLVGLATRLAALPLAGTMVVAIATAKWGELEGWTDLLFLSEFLALVLLLWLAAAGAGAVSLDRVIAGRKRD